MQNGPGRYDRRSGTSFATPHVTGTAALLHEYAQQNLARLGAEVQKHEVIKAVIMNSAEKVDGRLGMSKTVTKTDSSTWDQSDARDEAGNPGGRALPLDAQVGVGAVDAKRAKRQLSERSTFTRNPVKPVAWDWDAIATGDLSQRRYRLPRLKGESWLSSTLTWDRVVNLTDIPGGTAGRYDAGESFAPTPLANLDLYLMPRGETDLTKNVWSSVSTAYNLEHIFFKLPAGDAFYDLVVRNASEVAATYALAWWSERAPETLLPNDDSSTAAVDIGFPVQLFGSEYTQLFVNNNGNVTFGQPISTYTPAPFGTVGLPMLAPFWADVDTRSAGSRPVTYEWGDVDGRAAFTVNWYDVVYFPSQTDKLNRFKLVLVDRSDVAPGSFDAKFVYTQVRWETGLASSGVGGFGGYSARAGYTRGVAGQVYELPGSGVHGAFLDAAPTGLIHGGLNSSVPGEYVFRFRPNSPPDAVDDVATTRQGPVSVAVLTNDSDTDFDPLAVTGFTQGQHGTVTRSGSVLVYSPGAVYSGVDTFTYTVSDGRGGTDTGTVTVHVNRPPTLAMDTQRSRVLSIVLTFYEAVTVDPGAFTLTRVGLPNGEAGDNLQISSAVGGQIRVSSAILYGITNVVLTFEGNGAVQFNSLADGVWVLRADYTKVHAVAGGYAMADDFLTPVAGPGRVFRLFGDINGDGFVDGLDIGPFDAALNTQTGEPYFRYGFDLNGDGFIDGLDTGAFEVNVNSGID